MQAKILKDEQVGVGCNGKAGSSNYTSKFMLECLTLSVKYWVAHIETISNQKVTTKSCGYKEIRSNNNILRLLEIWCRIKQTTIPSQHAPEFRAFSTGGICFGRAVLLSVPE
jgi:hypothetical protein